MELLELSDWDAWTQASCFQARERLFCRYYRWAEIEAMQWLKKVGHTGAEVEDFVSAAHEGLLLAVDKYDPSKGFKFKTYAQYRIRGSVLNQVFKYSDKGQSYQKMVHLSIPDSKYVNSSHLDPDPLVALVGLIQDFTVEYLLEYSEIDICQNELLGYVFTSPEMNALKSQCLQLLDSLKGSEKTVMGLVYIHNIDMKAVSELLGISKGRVSQLHKQGIVKIRKSID